MLTVLKLLLANIFAGMLYAKHDGIDFVVIYEIWMNQDNCLVQHIIRQAVPTCLYMPFLLYDNLGLSSCHRSGWTYDTLHMSFQENVTLFLSHCFWEFFISIKFSTTLMHLDSVNDTEDANIVNHLFNVIQMFTKRAVTTLFHRIEDFY